MERIVHSVDEPITQVRGEYKNGDRVQIAHETGDENVRIWLNGKQIATIPLDSMFTVGASLYDWWVLFGKPSF